MSVVEADTMHPSKMVLAEERNHKIFNRDQKSPPQRWQKCLEAHKCSKSVNTYAFQEMFPLINRFARQWLAYLLKINYTCLFLRQIGLVCIWEALATPKRKPVTLKRRLFKFSGEIHLERRLDRLSGYYLYSCRYNPPKKYLLIICLKEWKC